MSSRWSHTEAIAIAKPLHSDITANNYERISQKKLFLLTINFSNFMILREHFQEWHFTEGLTQINTIHDI